MTNQNEIGYRILITDPRTDALYLSEDGAFGNELVPGHTWYRSKAVADRIADSARTAGWRVRVVQTPKPRG